MSTLLIRTIPRLLFTVLVSVGGFVSAAPIETHNETVIISNTRAEAHSGTGHATSSIVVTETINGQTTMYVRTVVDGVIHKHTTAADTSMMPQASQPSIVDTPLPPTVPIPMELEGDIQPTTTPSMQYATTTPWPLLDTASLTPAGDYSWWERVRTHFETVVLPYVISLWQPI